MNIEDFVSEALKQIGAGVHSAGGEPGIEVAPRPLVSEKENTAGGHMISVRGRNSIMLVEFDLSVAIQSKLVGEAGGRLTVLGIGGKAEFASAIDQTRIQRIKFQIPVAFKSRG